MPLKRRSCVVSSDDDETENGHRYNFRETRGVKDQESARKDGSIQDNGERDSPAKRTRSTATHAANSGRFSNHDSTKSNSSDDEVVMRTGRGDRKRSISTRRTAWLDDSQSTEDENERLSNSDSESDSGDINTTPLRTLRDRRKITSSDKKQKQRELRRLQRIRQRQNDRKAHRKLEESTESHAPLTVDDDDTGKKVPANERQTTKENDSENGNRHVSHVNSSDKSVLNSNTFPEDNFSSTMGQNSDTRRMNEQIVASLIPNSEIEGNHHTLEIIDLTDIQGTYSALPDDEKELLKQYTKAFPSINAHVAMPSTSNDSLVMPDCDVAKATSQTLHQDDVERKDDGAESSDSDILIRNTQKRVRKIHVESEDSDQAKSEDNAASDDDEDNGDDYSGDEEEEMKDFIVDDDEELEHVSSDGMLAEEGDSQDEDKTNQKRPMRFLVEKDLLSSGAKVTCIWLIEGRQLRQYNVQDTQKEKEGEGEDEMEEEELPEIYERTDKFCPYSGKIKHHYQAIDTIPLDTDEVNPSGSNSDVDVEAVEVISWDAPFEDETSPQLMPELFGAFAGGLRGVFEIYLQALLSTALDSEFLVGIYEERDPYFLPAVQKVDNDIEDRKCFLVKSKAWAPNFKKAIEKYPMIKVTEESTDCGRCQACTLKDRIGTRAVILHGDPYNRKTLEDIDNSDNSESDSESDIELYSDSELDYYPARHGKEFIAGRFCADRSTLYHLLHHFKLATFKECRHMVEFHSLVRPKMRDEDLISVVLEDKSWIDSVFSHLEHIMDRACKYTTDGKNYAPSYY
ncbi:uncharacterized protein LOC144448448 [Glandiceps talaboti]